MIMSKEYRGRSICLLKDMKLIVRQGSIRPECKDGKLLKRKSLSSGNYILHLISTPLYFTHDF